MVKPENEVPFMFCKFFSELLFVKNKIDKIFRILHMYLRPDNLFYGNLDHLDYIQGLCSAVLANWVIY